MFPAVDTSDPVAVEAEVQKAYLAMYPRAGHQFVPRAFGWVIESFSGGYADYQPVDALYHDLEHTLQGTLCMVRLLHGRFRAGAQPEIPQRLLELGLLAILLHDTGYLKRRDDTVGTGAKYTLTHVNRSAGFAHQLLSEKGFSDEDIASVQHMIRCTGINVNLAAIPFKNDVERLVGYALGTCDLLGQMAAVDYVEKLPILYAEFAEAAAYSGRLAGGPFSSAEDLIAQTPGFWRNYVLVRVTGEFGSLHRFLEDPYPGGRNCYLEAIEANIARLPQPKPGAA